ncbi:hypothetical protein CDD81_1560 [Ophiocordyceps australis]|uniref:Uncharacterized protein n=1 Tax=Ophiocordyceps australis TaxID=1399860 RepID=A0A2C5XTF4_9HYPO|nr:hypothetical protein CDD81_1560 [Ophiocordyceps australis]
MMHSFAGLFFTSLLSLQQVAATENVHCGQMQKSAFSVFVQGNPDMPKHLSTHCGNPLCYQALFSYLPDKLQEDIWDHWAANPYHLGQMLYIGEYYIKKLNFIPNSYKWYRNAAATQLEVCWHLDLADHLRVHKSSLGAVSNLLFQPSTKEWKMPRRFRDLPAGALRANETVCFDKTGIQYQWAKKQITNNLALFTNREGNPRSWSYEDLVHEYETWPGLIGPAMLCMMRKIYECDHDMHCMASLHKGRLFLPASHVDFLQKLHSVLDAGDAFCFDCSNTLLDEMMPDAYYFLPGIKAD